MLSVLKGFTSDYEICP